ncbi:glycosyltransferase family 1 protein [Phormidesmis priestleyi ULC007]|uniref:Glycosyltransferase family 1 protein n=1 Tax=Phormidesmis priestleyi ULC007 TaxID=1920490 RepID=A0A2T1D521_9CYAN|nr:glycosyltransferase family 4 protein [Phormidesmis priestleyi]PSB15603.1 glycosyltransferase family 1 protein [Phormidesmis priestleyi ULC007]
MRQPTLTIFYQFNPWNPSIGGIQTCIRSVIKYAPKEFQIRLVGTGGNDSAKQIGRWQDVELYGREFQFMPLIQVQNDNVRGVVPTTLKYTQALLGRDFSSDFLQFHRIEPTLVSSRLSGTKIFYIHNDIEQAVKGASKEGGIFWRHFPWAYFALERHLVSRFDRILSCNTKAADSYRHRYPDVADRVSYLPNTVDSDLFYPLSLDEQQMKRQELATKLGLAKDTQFILFAGRIHPQKQPLLLIRSFAALNEPQAHLLIVGQGELEEDVRAEIAQLGLSNRVTLMPPLQQSQLADLYRVSNIFVLTSAYEGLCRGSIEALACGTPVVTTRAGETPNFLTSDSGIVCDDQTPGAIADAWRRVLKHPADYPSQACIRVVKPYAAHHIVHNIYSELLERWQSSQHQSLEPCL